jgi:hypothetical protein
MRRREVVSADDNTGSHTPVRTNIHRGGAASLHLRESEQGQAKNVAFHALTPLRAWSWVLRPAPSQIDAMDLVPILHS